MKLWSVSLLNVFGMSCYASIAVSATLPRPEEIQGILMLCAGGITKEAQTAVQGKIEIWKREAELKGSADLSTLGAILRLSPDGKSISEKNYSRYIDCVTKQTADYLQQDSASLNILELTGSFRVVDSIASSKEINLKHDVNDLNHAASDLADKFMSYVESLDKGETYPVVLTVADNKLVIKHDANKVAKLYITRFDRIKSLNELDKILQKASRHPEEQISIDSLIAREGGENRSVVNSENRDWKLRQGVYRVAIVSPLYRTAVKYIELNSNGVLATQSPSKRLQALPNDWLVELYRRSDRTELRVAVRPFKMTAVTRPDMQFLGEERKLEAEFLSNLNKTGRFEAFATMNKLTRYDAGTEKGGRAMHENLDRADFEVEVVPVLAPAPVQINHAK